MTRKHRPPDLAKLVQGFFGDRLIQQQNVSPNTVASYRDTFRLLLVFVRARHRRSPSLLTFDDFDAPTILAFLNDLEKRRGNSVRTRNTRLAALRAFVTYASACEPILLPLAQRILAIPSKRFNRPLLGYLTRAEIEAILAAPDQDTWSGCRDQVLFALMYNVGLRVSEVIGLDRHDVTIGPVASIRIHGKGRKERHVPLWKRTAHLLTNWLIELPSPDETPLFPNRHGGRLTRSGVEDRLQQALQRAAQQCASLREKNVSPHTLRHTTAMHLLQAGVDVTLIALWLGHESPETTHQYVEADVEMKRRVLDQLDEPDISTAKKQTLDPLLDFLNQL